MVDLDIITRMLWIYLKVSPDKKKRLARTIVVLGPCLQRKLMRGPDLIDNDLIDFYNAFSRCISRMQRMGSGGKVHQNRLSRFHINAARTKIPPTHIYAGSCREKLFQTIKNSPIFLREDKLIYIDKCEPFCIPLGSVQAILIGHHL